MLRVTSIDVRGFGDDGQRSTRADAAAVIRLLRAMEKPLRPEPGRPAKENGSNTTVPRAQPFVFSREKTKPYNLYGLTVYFFLLATTLTFRVCEIAPTVSASLIISACSC